PAVGAPPAVGEQPLAVAGAGVDELRDTPGEPEPESEERRRVRAGRPVEAGAVGGPGEALDGPAATPRAELFVVRERAGKTGADVTGLAQQLRGPTGERHDVEVAIGTLEGDLLAV